MAASITPESLAAQLAETSREQQGSILRAALTAQWQPQLAAYLDYWARLGLARLRAAHGRTIAIAPLSAATGWIAPTWPGDTAPQPSAPTSDAPLTAQEIAFRMGLATYWEAQLAARLDFGTTDTLAKVRAAPDPALSGAALAPLLAARVDIEVAGPDA